MEVGHRQSVPELKRSRATVGGLDDQGVIDEVDRDLERCAAMMQTPCREPANIDVQRDVPPMVARRGGREPDLSEDLAVEMERVFRPAPVAQVQLGQRHGVPSSNATLSM